MTSFFFFSLLQILGCTWIRLQMRSSLWQLSRSALCPWLCHHLSMQETLQQTVKRKVDVSCCSHLLSSTFLLAVPSSPPPLPQPTPQRRLLLNSRINRWCISQDGGDWESSCYTSVLYLNGNPHHPPYPCCKKKIKNAGNDLQEPLQQKPQVHT